MSPEFLHAFMKSIFSIVFFSVVTMKGTQRIRKMFPNCISATLIKILGLKIRFRDTNNKNTVKQKSVINSMCLDEISLDFKLFWVHENRVKIHKTP